MKRLVSVIRGIWKSLSTSAYLRVKPNTAVIARTSLVVAAIATGEVGRGVACFTTSDTDAGFSRIE